MKKLLWICAVLALASPAALAHAGGGPPASASAFSLSLTGGEGPNEIAIGISADHEEYWVRANGAIGPVRSCTNPPDEPNELRCPAAQVTSFVVRTLAGNDTVVVAAAVPVSVIVEGGKGLDDLTGGANADRLLGGEGDDLLIGRGASDVLYGGRGADRLFGGTGKDVLRGGPGDDRVDGGRGRDDVRS